MWPFTPISHIDLADLAGAVVAGVVGSGLAVVFATTVRLLRRAPTRVPRWLAPVLGGIVLAGLAVWRPFALTFGEEQLHELLVPGVLLTTLVVALIAKLVATRSASRRAGRVDSSSRCSSAVRRRASSSTHVLTGPSPSVLVVGVMVATVVGVDDTPSARPWS